MVRPRTNSRVSVLLKLVEYLQDLVNLSVMDEEDGTINTRLAKGAIDAMFCNSPLPPHTSAQKDDSPPKTVAGFTIFSDN